MSGYNRQKKKETSKIRCGSNVEKTGQGIVHYA